MTLSDFNKKIKNTVHFCTYVCFKTWTDLSLFSIVELLTESMKINRTKLKFMKTHTAVHFSIYVIHTKTYVPISVYST